jgi:hypothetical protein
MMANDIAMRAAALHTGEVVGSIPTAPTTKTCIIQIVSIQACRLVLMPEVGQFRVRSHQDSDAFSQLRTAMRSAAARPLCAAPW